MGCFINNYNNNIDYTSIAQGTGYRTYAVFSIIFMGINLLNLVIILILKLIQLIKFDIIKTLYNMSNLKANFNMTNYILQNLFLCSFVNAHFIFFHQFFKTTLPTCLGVSYSYDYGSNNAFYSNSSSVIRY